MIAIKTVRLTKHYDDFPALTDLNLEVESGTIYGLVGPNGAGKTTAIKILTCLVKPTSGGAEVNGISVTADPTAVKSAIGYLAENSHLYEDMTVSSYLRFFADIYGIEKTQAPDRINRLLMEMKMPDRAQSQIGTLSKGLKRRVSIARALLHDPPILILDEVASGLDPISTHELREYLLHQRSLGKTILLSTHNLYEAELLCDKVTIMDKGRTVTSGTITELSEKYLNKSDNNPETSLERIFYRAIAEQSTARLTP